MLACYMLWDVKRCYRMNDINCTNEFLHFALRDDFEMGHQ